MHLPYQIPDIYANHTEYIESALRALGDMNGQFVDLYIDGRHFQVSCLEDFDSITGITVGMWEKDAGGLRPAGRAQVQRVDLKKKIADMFKSFQYRPDSITENTLDFYGITTLAGVDEGYAFGIEESYQGMGLSQILFAILLHCLNSAGVEFLRITSDETVEQSHTNFIRCSSLVNEDGAEARSNDENVLHPVTYGSLYLKYGRSERKIGIFENEFDQDNFFLERIDPSAFITVSTNLTSIQQQLIVHILSNR